MCTSRVESLEDIFEYLSILISTELYIFLNIFYLYRGLGLPKRGLTHIEDIQLVKLYFWGQILPKVSYYLFLQGVNLQELRVRELEFLFDKRCMHIGKALDCKVTSLIIDVFVAEKNLTKAVHLQIPFTLHATIKTGY